MGYMNPFYHYGVENFLKKAQELDISGFIIPDLPYEEAKVYDNLFEKYNKALINFVAPTTDTKRIKKIIANSKKFIYLVAYAGITGSGADEDLSSIIDNLKQNTKTPIYLGFGVDEKTAKQKAKNVDGVIVGTAFVKHLIDDSLNNNEKISKILTAVRQIKEEIN
jgi:tryptophan synthase alpha chain